MATTTTAATTTTTDPGFTATSDDGRVTIEVTPDALADDPGITITALTTDAHPEELTGLSTVPIVYALEPGQLEFDAPVRISVTIPIEEMTAPGFEAMLPVATLITTTTDGTGWQFLDDIRVSRDAQSFMISGLTDHFSRLAVVPEQVFIESRFIEITPTRTMDLGFDFFWANGVELATPQLTGTFIPFETSTDPGDVAVGIADGTVSLTCPPDIATVIGDLELEAALRAVEDDSGETGLVTAPQITTLQQQEATVTFTGGIQLLCTPTITADGTLTMDVSVDHPGGVTIVPGEDFKGGLSALYIDFGLGLPPLYVGLIRDVDSDGRIGPNDIMYPPQPTDITDGVSTVVIPLYAYGDYFPYILGGEVRELQTELLVRDGATIVLGGLMQEETAVPFLGDLPYLARVFSDESRTIDETELVIFITPRIFQESAE